MAELNRLIAETREWRAFHVQRRNMGIKGAGIEALACSIREKALLEAKRAFERTNREAGG